MTDRKERGWWIWWRCYACGHRLSFASTGCPQCGEVFNGRNPPKTWPEQCACHRCAAAQGAQKTGTRRVVSWLDSEQRRADRWTRNAQGILYFQLNGVELQRLRSALMNV